MSDDLTPEKIADRVLSSGALITAADFARARTIIIEALQAAEQRGHSEREKEIIALLEDQASSVKLQGATSKGVQKSFHDGQLSTLINLIYLVKGEQAQAEPQEIRCKFKMGGKIQQPPIDEE